MCRSQATLPKPSERKDGHRERGLTACSGGAAMTTRPIVLMALLTGACSASHTPLDPAAPADAGPELRDAGDPIDPPLGSDAGRAVPDPDGGRAIGDAGPNDGAGVVACGATSCELPGTACRATCRTGGEPTPACVVAPETWEIGECPSEEETFPIVVARCDGPEDCPGAACLVLHGSVGNYPQCMCHDDGEGGCVARWSVVLCHTLADCPSWATACEPDTSSLAGFYRTCVE